MPGLIAFDWLMLVHCCFVKWLCENQRHTATSERCVLLPSTLCAKLT